MAAEEQNQVDNEDLSPIALDQRYTLYPGKPLPTFHAQPAMAYKVIDAHNPEEEMYGLVCDPKMQPRLSILETLSTMAKTQSNIVCPIAWCVTYWEEEGRECPVLIYKIERLIPFNVKQSGAIADDDILVRFFLRSVIDILCLFENNNVTHRAIHINNLYYKNELKRNIVLGDCLATPPGMTQGALFDTMDAGLSVPLGKGAEFNSDDVYALGMVVLCLLHGRNLGLGMSDEEIIARKMMYGSYKAFLSPKMRLTASMENLLMAMLDDNANTRAKPSDLKMWLNGQTLITESLHVPKRSSKPMMINNHNFFAARELAKGMADHWDMSIKKVGDADFTDWVHNNLSETHVTLAYDAALKGFESVSHENQNRLLARIILALHPTGPIRFRSFSATIDGMLRLISHFVHHSEAREVFRQLMGSGLIQFWDSLRQRDAVLIRDNLLSRYENFIEELRKDSPIEGLNVLIYNFNPDLPCQSKRFERYFVYQPRHMLPAIESILEHDDAFDSLIDFHMICFLKVRYKRSIAKEIRAYMISSVPEDACLAEAEILAKLQVDFYPKRDFVRICRKLCELLEPAVKRHHSRTVRKKIREEIRREAERGEIRRLLQIVMNKNLVGQDQVNFNLARAEYATILQEISFVDFNLRNLSAIVSKVSGDLGGWIAGVLASLIALSYVFYWSLFL